MTAVPADDERESIFSVTTATTTTTTTTTRRCFEEKTRKKKQKRTRIDFAPGRWARGTRKGPKGPPHIVCFFLVFLFLFLFLAPWVMFPYPFIFSSPLFFSFPALFNFWVRGVESSPACYVCSLSTRYVAFHDSRMGVFLGRPDPSPSVIDSASAMS